MRAAFVRDHGGPEVLEVGDLPDPSAGPGQVLVRVETAGVGPWDVGVVSGRFPVPVSFPLVPGGETVGEVVAVGHGVDRLRVGDRVMSAGFSGGLAELAALDANTVGPAPTSLAAVEAASLPVDAATADTALEQLGLQPGDTLLITGAGTLVGHFAVQLAAVRGVRVVATAGERNHERLRRLGADVVVDYAGDWVGALRPHGPVDAALDVAGGSAPTQAFDLLRDGARMVTVVRPEGDVEPPRGITFTPQHTTVDHGMLERIAALVDEGRVVPLVAQTHPLDDAAGALRAASGRHDPGKVVVRVAG